MFGGIRKVPVSCPHCGFVQNEPASLISTYCRGCGDHFTVGQRLPSPPVLPSPTAAATGPRSPQSSRRVVCESCNLDHPASNSLTTATCPTCGHVTDLANCEILSHSTRPIDTCGTVHVARTGFLNATHTRCGSAIIEGRFAGRIDCSGTLRLRGSGPSGAQIKSRSIIIDRGSDFRFRFPIRAGEILIRGRIEAEIVCPGTVRVGRHGSLVGSVRARSLIVDKGGCYQGDVEVATGIQDQSPRDGTRPSEPILRVIPAWQSLFARA